MTLIYIFLILFIVYLANNTSTTPEQLEKKHREILNNVKARFPSKIAYSDLKRNISNNPFLSLTKKIR